MATFTNTETGKTKEYVNLIKFLRYQHYSSWISNAYYVNEIEIVQLPDGGASVMLKLPNGYIVDKWASYNVAVDYFTRRSYILRDVHTIILVLDKEEQIG